MKHPSIPSAYLKCTDCELTEEWKADTNVEMALERLHLGGCLRGVFVSTHLSIICFVQHMYVLRETMVLSGLISESG
ncbi:hypothetical protein SCLCIDRAFT_1210469 [Scleroderma citrinum Foug A]|uniref:Uncharacterized protein n=1 Tax=Scleroderma citrinum Foug A TaxID=1036808 RepID=A0A0C3APX3_9AGAM|nr:hypothetical protein SCLCIDRAFT_1210469 [Scleroderma citrinum Foug A]